MLMANLSTARKAGIVLRVVAQHARRNRILSGVIHACRITAGHFARILHQLWLEVTGLVFLALAVVGALAFAREYMKHQAGNGSFSRAGLAICFTLLFGWFGVSSFWRVRKKRVSR
jgi:hypothetical protein